MANFPSPVFPGRNLPNLVWHGKREYRGRFPAALLPAAWRDAGRRASQAGSGEPGAGSGAAVLQRPLAAAAMR